MSERIKVLIGYDGSTYADAALDDLRRAGLPHEVEALIVSVGDAFIRDPLASHDVIERAFTSKRAETIIEQVNKQVCESMQAANKLAAEASERLYSFFPDWLVRVETLAGAPSQELIRKADEWKANLIVVGSQGRSALGRFFLGSVSKTVAAEARCSVRVARRGIEKGDTSPLRIVLAVDGSPGSERAVRALGSRHWAESPEVSIIVVDDGRSPTRIANIQPATAGLITGDNEGEAVKARVMLEWAAEELRASGLNISTVIREGDPQTVLIEEARSSEANCIYVGAFGFHTVPGKPGLGSVASALVTNAPCTVEIVRS